MASTSRSSASASTRKAFLLLAMATMANAQALVSEGCYKSVTPLKSQGTDIYQSSGACSKTCAGQAVFALSQGNVCYCGSELPAASSKTSTSACNIPCVGYPGEPCGGATTFTVWLTGIDNNPPVYSGGSSSGGSSAAGTTTSPPSTTSTSGRHSVITSVQQGTTVYVTHSDSPSSSPTSSSGSGSGSGSGGGTSVAGIAAGVVVGVVAATAIVAGVVFYLRHRRKQAAEEEYKRTQVSDFIRGGDKPPNTGYSQASDSRLDPESGARRNSEGSIADAGDYSRRILRVANPDHS